MINFNQHYFKDLSEQCYIHNKPMPDLDLSQITPVDNSHFYLPSYHRFTDCLFFIDYPDQLATNIVEIYRKKRYADCNATLLSNHRHMIPDAILSRACPDNIVKILSVLWIRQLTALRNNSALAPVQLADFFDRSKMIAVCETLIGQPISNIELFDQSLNNWVNNNTQLAQLFGN